MENTGNWSDFELNLYGLVAGKEGGVLLANLHSEACSLRFRDSRWSPESTFFVKKYVLNRKSMKICIKKKSIYKDLNRHLN